MAAKKYLVPDTVTGGVKQQAAVASSSGSGNDGDLVALDSTGKIDTTMMPTGVGPDTVTVLASEALAAGDFVNIYNNGGTPNVRKADASGANASKEAHGFVLANVSNGANATVYLRGQNTGLSGLTAAPKFLSGGTPGASTSTAPSTAGHIIQRLGTAINATTINFAYNPPILLA